MKSHTPTAVYFQLSILALALLSSPISMADTEPHWYIGASGGPTQAKIDNAQILRNFSADGLGQSYVIDTRRGNGYKVFSGYQFNNLLALEGSYFDLGTFSFAGTTTPPGTYNGDIRLRGFGLDAVLSAPLTNKLSVFVKAGANYAEARDRFSGSGPIVIIEPAPTKTELNPKIGFGVQYALSDAFHIRAELERYRINDALGSRGDIDHLSVGLVYSWGLPRKTEPAAEMPLIPVAKEEAKAPVAETAVLPTAPVAPKVESPPPAPAVVPAKLTLASDSLFAFGKSNVSADGKKKLDELVTKLKTLNYEFITVTGHTDRLGARVYNLRLSEQRAREVANYLTQVGGIPEDKVLARGQNGSNPVTAPGDCVGTRATPALIACLQPDRRVALEVTGTPLK